ncbi:MAG: hypothetical protein H0V67_11365 [Geodermatophilaceae bacterium]|nr:hypothetical protein [Geodermatophilaceae bacterium]
MVTEQRRRQTGSTRAVVVAALLVAGSVAVGLVLVANDVLLYLGGPLLAAAWDPRLEPGVLAPVLVGGALLLYAGRLAGGLAWARLLPLAGLAAAAWAVALALVDGASGLTRGLSSTHDYLNDVPRVTSIADLLSGYVANIPGDSAAAWTTHVGGHPPGPLLAFAVLDSIGLGGTGWAALLCIGAGASAVPAMLIATRVITGEGAARAAAPFLVLAPAAIWLATSADALFLGVSAWGIAALVVAARASSGWLALVGGVLMGATLFLSYGMLLLGPLALAVILVRRNWRVLAVAAGGVLLVMATFAVAGFWWLSGLFATMDRVSSGAAAQSRPAWFFVFANLAVVAVAIGPAGVAGLGQVVSRAHRRTTVALLPLGALAGILIADLTLLSKGEVERIYLPFFGWLLTATALLDEGQRRRWLVAQAGTALAVQLLVRTSW